MWHIDDCEVDGLRLQGLAAGGEATSIRVSQWGVIFDIGVCLPECIAHRYHSLLLSHGHADHAAALVYMLGQRGMRRLGPIDVYLPQELVDPIGRLIEVWKDIEGYDREANLVPVSPGQSWRLRSGQEVMALRTVHRIPSLAYLLGDPKPQKGAPFEPHLCVTGDTKIEFIQSNPIAQQSRVLVHEITAWDEQRSVAQTRERGHTHVQELLDNAACLERVKKLVLVHRSARHSRRFAERTVAERFPEQLAAKTVIFG